MDALIDATSHSLGAWLFLRLLGVIYAIAFASLGVQIVGLIGQNGILPAGRHIAGQKAVWSSRRWLRMPTLCWWINSDRALRGLCWCGVGLSLLLVLGLAPVPVLIALWFLYLSLFHVGQVFLGYQWDVLLLETGFLAIWLAPLHLAPVPPSDAPPALALALFYLLLFRLIFFSGFVKLRSGDPAWRSLTALCHHYGTQPLPTPMAWRAWQLPRAFHRVSALVMFAIELLVPFLFFCPQPIRSAAGLTIVALMVLIQLTGNYGFFNLITAALALLLLDDSILRPLVASLPLTDAWRAAASAVHWPAPVLWAVAALIGTLSLERFFRLFRWEFRLPPWLTKVDESLSPWQLVSSYGLFSVMTTERPEIIVEGSDDGQQWRAYEFKYKAGEPRRKPPWVAPHQPRLDWQMWFAALGDYRVNGWLLAFLRRLLEGRAEVQRLLAHDPFAGGAPRYVRAVLYDYRFSDWKTRRVSGAWWVRERKWLYCPVLSLRGVEQEFMPPADLA